MATATQDALDSLGRGGVGNGARLGRGKITIEEERGAIEQERGSHQFMLNTGSPSGRLVPGSKQGFVTWDQGPGVN